MKKPLSPRSQKTGNRYISFRQIRHFTLITAALFMSVGTKAQITGPSSVCVAATITLSVTPTGGTWTSSAPGVATVGSSSGIVTGVTAGTTTIHYASGLTGFNQVVT